MLLLTVQQLYEHVATQECYSQATSLTMMLDAQKIIINLVKEEDAKCAFPRGVFVGLEFIDQALNSYNIFYNFDYQTSTQLTFKLPCVVCSDYENVANALLVIESAQLRTELMVGAVENIREFMSRCNTQGNLLVYQDFDTANQFVQYRIANACNDIIIAPALQSATLAITTFDGKITQLTRCTKQANQATFVFTDELDLKAVNKGISAAILDVVYVKNTIIKSLQSLAGKTYIGKGEPFKNVQLTILANAIQFTATREQDFEDLKAYLLTLSVATQRIQIHAEFRDKNYSLNFEFVEEVSENNGLLLCESTGNAAECKSSLSMLITEYQKAEVKIIIQYLDNNSIPLHTLQFYPKEIDSVCYSQALMNVTRGKAVITFTIVQEQFCFNSEKQDTQFQLGHYKTSAAKIVNSIDELVVDKTFQISNFSNADLVLSIRLSNQEFQDFFSRKNKKEVYSYQVLLFDGDRNVLQNIDVVEYTLVDQQGFMNKIIVYSSVGMAVVIIFVISFQVLLPKFKQCSKQKKSVVTVKDDL